VSRDSAWSVPERYGVGELYRRLRVCERFGLGIGDVLPGFDPNNESHMASVMAFEHLREVEEARERMRL